MTVQQEDIDTAPTPEEPTTPVGGDGAVSSFSASWNRIWGWGLPLTAVVCAALMMLLDLSPQIIGGIGCLLMMSLMMMKMPVGLAMAIPGAIGVYSIVGDRALEGMFRRMPYETVASWSLTVVPMFVLMGALLFSSGITERIYAVARQWLGWMPGGLAVGTNFAGAGFASLSGSTLGSVFPLARAGVPEMLKAGYDRRLAVGSVMAAGTLAHLIPPSLFLIIYAGVAEVAVGPQLMAGLVPGVLLAFMYGAFIILLAMLRPRLAGGPNQVRVRATWGERIRGVYGILAAPALVILVIAGMQSGIFTATEAGAAGALGALVILLWMRRRDRPLRSVREGLYSTAGVTGAVFLLLVGSHMFSRLLSVSGLADGFVEIIIAWDLSRVQFLIVMVIVYVILGMFMDAMPMMLLTVPILLPLFSAMDISPLWFGVFIVIFMELAVLTPPIGVLGFVVHGIVQDPDVNNGQRISLGDVFTAVFVLMPIPLLLVGLMIAFPDFVTWVPDQMAGR
ncbi:TRAP transporter large permease [Aeromicrobium sp. YIM 150415]|uniref:TRAP transporter large permease n=1 Tax=Aeromicrobium sp. YIM 150415 TaxID=2803912 RepID=UPI001965327C|nr:TRAP transporter large permease [Aeromicrobium sp. YIM 150415]MBM9463600.1 TRAP transporter large permease [Aeromicrobium sp. YIM 150415]